MKGLSGAHFLQWNQNSKFWVTWPRIAQSVYFLREMCSFFNFWMIKFTIMCFFDIHTWNFSTKVLYMSKKHISLENVLVLLSLVVQVAKYFLICTWIFRVSHFNFCHDMDKFLCYLQKVKQHFWDVLDEFDRQSKYLFRNCPPPSS